MYIFHLALKTMRSPRGLRRSWDCTLHARTHTHTHTRREIRLLACIEHLHTFHQRTATGDAAGKAHRATAAAADDMLTWPSTLRYCCCELPAQSYLREGRGKPHFLNKKKLTRSLWPPNCSLDIQQWVIRFGCICIPFFTLRYNGVGRRQIIRP